MRVSCSVNFVIEPEILSLFKVVPSDSFFSSKSSLLIILVKTLLSITREFSGKLYSEEDSLCEPVSWSVSITHCSTRPKRNVINPMASEILNFENGNVFFACCCD